MSPAEQFKLVDSAVVKLAEHFDSVQILVTKVTPKGGTQFITSGSGDWFARKAACQEFVERDQADTVARTIRKVSNEE